MSVKYLIGVDLMEGNYVWMRSTLSKCRDLSLSHGLHPTATPQTHVLYLRMGRKHLLRISTWPRVKNIEATTEIFIKKKKMLIPSQARLYCIYTGFEQNSIQALLCTPAADDFNSVLLATLLVPALPADGETALAQRRLLKTQLVMQEKLGLLRENNVEKKKKKMMKKM